MIEIARILKPQGIRGEVKMQLFSDNFDEFCSRGFAYVKRDGSQKKITYTTLRKEPPYVYLRIDGINTRDEAEGLKGVFLYLDKSVLAAPDEGEYFIFELIGLKVIDAEGNDLGVIDDVLQHGAADVYVVKGIRNFMFPALKNVIEKVDIKKGLIVVRSKALQEVAVYDDI